VLLASALAATAALLAGCGSRSHAPRATRLPAGFAPQALSATGAQDVWLLGRVPCRGSRCFAIAKSTDGGESFVVEPAPRLPTQGNGPELWRSGADDAFVLVPGVHPAFYETHDGAATWQRSDLRNVIAFTVAGTRAFAVAAQCGDRGCADYHLIRGSTSGTSWVESRLPFTPDGSVLDLAARGTNVWLLGTPTQGQKKPHDVLARSADAGRTFTIGPGPCVPGLGGDLQPTSDDVVWAVCPTGMEAGAWRSDDGGVTFAPLRTPILVNSSRLAPASAQTAALVGRDAGARVIRTTDGGTTWSHAVTPPGGKFVTSLGFVDHKVGYALVQTGWNAKAKIEEQVLWRTTDGGAHWDRVSLR
jgi:photosystem II stability/assembly factor-like uncharacterized protein